MPDITVFGSYTYLATEVFWGAVALALLWNADALRSAARTIVALYPLAYVWDWYTLEVGIFSIEMRTGVDLLGIPIEEHVFILVVPALVLGVHETLQARLDDAGPRDDAGQPDHTGRPDSTGDLDDGDHTVETADPDRPDERSGNSIDR